MRGFVASASGGGGAVVDNSAVVALGGSGSAYSTDLVTWNSGSSLSGSQSVWKFSNQYLAIPGSSNTFVSADGITWGAGGSLPAGGVWFQTAREKDGGAQFIAFSLFGTTLNVSSDGLAWTSRSFAVGNVWDAVWSAARGLWIAGGDTGVLFQTSVNAAAWTAYGASPLGAGSTCNALAYFGSALISAGDVPGTSTEIWRSTDDGLTFTRVLNLGTPTNPVRAAYGGGVMLICASSDASGSYFRSTDGITWSQLAMPLAGRMFGMTYRKNKFVGINNAGIVFVSSDLGLSWTTADVSAIIGGGENIA